MAPITPFWPQPSHPDVQEVIYSTEGGEYMSKSISMITLAPGKVFAEFTFPPCNYTDTPTYATVQVDEGKHMNLNSDLVYINHSCEPSVIFDTTRNAIIAGPRGLFPGQELTFFYPSTEWSMAQAFDCHCGTATCLGRIAGAQALSLNSISRSGGNGKLRLAEGKEKSMFFNQHIARLVEKHMFGNGAGLVDGAKANGNGNGNGHGLGYGKGANGHPAL